MPSDAHEGAELIRHAVDDPNPVIFVWSPPVFRDPRSNQAIPCANHCRSVEPGSAGREATTRSSPAATWCRSRLEAAEIMEAAGAPAEGVDPRTPALFDHDTVRASVRGTGRLVGVNESTSTCSMACPVPSSPVLEDFVLPDDQIVALALALPKSRPSSEPALWPKASAHDGQRSAQPK